MKRKVVLMVAGVSLVSGLAIADCTYGLQGNCSSNSDCNTFTSPTPANCADGWGDMTTGGPSGTSTADIETYSGGSCIDGWCANGTLVSTNPNQTYSWNNCALCGG